MVAGKATISCSRCDKSGLGQIEKLAAFFLKKGVLLQDLQSQLQQAESGQQQRSEAGARAEDQVEQLKQQVTDLQAILAAEADRQQLCSDSNRPALRSPTRSHGPAGPSSPAHLHHKIQELEVSLLCRSCAKSVAT